MRATPTTVFDGHPDSPRLMYYTGDGARYTPEQWQLIQFMVRLEKKFDRVIELLESHGHQQRPKT